MAQLAQAITGEGQPPAVAPEPPAVRRGVRTSVEARVAKILEGLPAPRGGSAGTPAPNEVRWESEELL